MPYTVFIFLGISAFLLILSLLFRLAGKLRLTLPLLYFLLTATVLNPWAAAHETLALAILFCLLAFSVISWLFSFKNAIHDRKYYKALEEDINWQVKRARDNGISMDSVYFDSAGNMRYKNTKEIVDYGTEIRVFFLTIPSSPVPHGPPSSQRLPEPTC